MRHLKGKQKPENEQEYLKRRIEALENEIKKRNPNFKLPKRKKFMA